MTNLELSYQPTIKEGLRMAEQNIALIEIKKYVKTKHEGADARKVMAEIAKQFLATFKKN